MDGQYRLRSLCDGLCRRGGVEVQTVAVDVDEDGGRPDMRDGVGGRHESERRRHDLVTRADTDPNEGEMKSGGTRGNCHDFTCSHVVAKLLLEQRDKWPLPDPAAP